MNIKLSIHVVGTFLKFFGLLQLLPAICSIIYRDNEWYIFFVTAFTTSILGFVMEKTTKEARNTKELYRKDAFLIALSCWIAASLFGSLPYLFLPSVFSPIDALFESISGYTTTGATIISDIEILPRGLLFYRSFTQWLGGMGIIVLAIAVLPKLSVGGMQLMSQEVPGPTAERLTPQIADTAKKLWLIYVALSIVLVVLLLISGLSVFESVTTMFSAISTGGFTIYNASIGAYGSSLVEFIVIIFMVIGGSNFLLLYLFFTGKFSKLLNSSEFRFYITLILIFIAVVTLDLRLREYPGFVEALRYGSFQVVSILTGTGFSSTDFGIWPKFAVFALLIVMFIGGCAGSTTGSIKVIRILVLIKKGIREINHLIIPKAVLPVRIDKRAVSEEIISSVTSFFLLFIVILIISVLIILSVEDISVLGALSACSATLANVGPGFEEVGAAYHYKFLSGFSKLWLCFLMILGRLEIYTVLVFFAPLFWRK